MNAVEMARATGQAVGQIRIRINKLGKRIKESPEGVRVAAHEDEIDFLLDLQQLLMSPTKEETEGG